MHCLVLIIWIGFVKSNLWLSFYMLWTMFNFWRVCREQWFIKLLAEVLHLFWFQCFSLMNLRGRFYRHDIYRLTYFLNAWLFYLTGLLIRTRWRRNLVFLIGMSILFDYGKFMLFSNLLCFYQFLYFFLLLALFYAPCFFLFFFLPYLVSIKFFLLGFFYPVGI